MSNAKVLKRARVRDILELFASRQAKFAINVFDRDPRLPERAVADCIVEKVCENNIPKRTLYTVLRKHVDDHHQQRPVEAYSSSKQTRPIIRRAPDPEAAAKKRARRQERRKTGPQLPMSTTTTTTRTPAADPPLTTRSNIYRTTTAVYTAPPGV
jgi:hypothetical protein